MSVEVKITPVSEKSLDGTEEIFTVPLGFKEYDRPYLLEAFPEYDYRFPQEPWKIDYRKPENRILVSWQVQAFHYWWAIHQTVKNGGIGYSIMTPYLPHMLYVPTWDTLCVPALNEQPCKIIICSAGLPIIRCKDPKERGSHANCIIPFLEVCVELLESGGVLAGIVLDEQHANNVGASVKQIGHHTWTANQFHSLLQDFILRNPVTVEEFDTLKNYFAFNFVLRKN